MPDLPDQFVVVRKATAECYHTDYCISVKRAGAEAATPVTDRTIEWHDLPKCQFCSGESENKIEVKADD